MEALHLGNERAGIPPTLRWESGLCTRLGTADDRAEDKTETGKIIFMAHDTDDRYQDSLPNIYDICAVSLVALMPLNNFAEAEIASSNNAANSGRGLAMSVSPIPANTPRQAATGSRQPGKRRSRRIETAPRSAQQVMRGTNIGCHNGSLHASISKSFCGKQ